MRVVVDTNVIVSGLREGSQPPCQIIDLWRDGEIDILSSEATIAELTRVLGYPKVRQLTRYSDERVQQFLTEFRHATIQLDIENDVDVVKSDPTDNIFLSLAEAGKAQYIITGDTKHLLPIKDYKDIQIITPATFIARFAIEQ